MHECVDSTFCSEAHYCNIPLQNSVAALISTVRSKPTLKQVARPISHISSKHIHMDRLNGESSSLELPSLDLIKPSTWTRTQPARGTDCIC